VKSFLGRRFPGLSPSLARVKSGRTYGGVGSGPALGLVFCGCCVSYALRRKHFSGQLRIPHSFVLQPVRILEHPPNPPHATRFGTIDRNSPHGTTPNLTVPLTCQDVLVILSHHTLSSFVVRRLVGVCFLERKSPTSVPSKSPCRIHTHQTILLLPGIPHTKSLSFSKPQNGHLLLEHRNSGRSSRSGTTLLDKQ